MRNTIRLATRGSALALWQANHVSDLITQAEPSATVELVVLSTRPDRHSETPLSDMGGDKGLFVKEIEQAVLDGRADVAVHSLKDVPVEESTADLALVAFPERATPGDVLISRSGATLEQLPAGAVVATSALRRQAQLLRARPDLRVQNIRGNVDTRLRKLEAGEFDALILAAAGVERLGFGERITQRLPLDQFLPAPGQGILAVQSRVDSPFAGIWRQLDSPGVRAQAQGERLFSRTLGASCHSAAACYLEPQDDGWLFRGAVFSSDGHTRLYAEGSSGVAGYDGLVRQAAAELLAGGAAKLL